MKLISCYISGFGNLRDASFTFQDGFQQFLAENGWGKTTLFVFIKAMFYGLEYRRGSSRLYERTHYLPWEQGTYGGNLRFAAGDRVFRIERTFGKKNTEDTFCLFDEETGKESTAYSSAIGEELFGVDRESFEKSVYFGQSLLAASMTDSLNAKMGNLTAVKDDISQFDSAVKRIEEAKKVYTQRSRLHPGRLALIKEDIQACREAREKIPIMYAAVSERKRLLEEKREGLRELSGQKERLAERIARLGEEKQRLGAYREKQQLLEKQQEALAHLRTFFNGETPTKEDVSRYQETERELVALDGRGREIAARMPSEEEQDFLERLFAEKEPTEAELSNYEAQAEQLKELRLRTEHTRMPEGEQRALDGLKKFFENGLPSQEELSVLREKAGKQIELEGGGRALEQRRTALLEKESELAAYRIFAGGGAVKLLLLLLSAVLLAGGALLFYLRTSYAVNPMIPFVCLGSGVLLLLLGLFLMQQTFRQRSRQREELRQQEQTLEEERAEQLRESRALAEECRAFIASFPQPDDDADMTPDAGGYLGAISAIQRKRDRYDLLLAKERAAEEDASADMERLSDIQLQLYTELQPYAQEYGYDLFAEHRENELLQKISRDRLRYREYRENEDTLLALRGEAGAKERRLISFIERFQWKERLSLSESLLALIEKIREQDLLKKQIADLTEELKGFSAEDRKTGGEDAEALQEEQKALDEAYVAQHQLIMKEEDEIANIGRQIEEQEEAGRALEPLLEEEAQMKEKVRLYEDTILYLTQAKEEFLSHFMTPLRRKMAYYLERLQQTSGKRLAGEDVILDMDLSVRLSYHGSTKEEGYLSAGYRDLVALCARLALIDVLYRSQQPILMLDDPFVNLDKEKTADALALLTELGKERQILYVTCHESRMTG